MMGQGMVCQDENSGRCWRRRELTLSRGSRDSGCLMLQLEANHRSCPSSEGGDVTKGQTPVKDRNGGQLKGP